MIKVELSLHCDIYSSDNKTCVRKTGERNMIEAVKERKEENSNNLILIM